MIDYLQLPEGEGELLLEQLRRLSDLLAGGKRRRQEREETSQGEPGETGPGGSVPGTQEREEASWGGVPGEGTPPRSLSLREEESRDWLESEQEDVPVLEEMKRLEEAAQQASLLALGYPQGTGNGGGAGEGRLGLRPLSLSKSGQSRGWETALTGEGWGRWAGTGEVPGLSASSAWKAGGGSGPDWGEETVQAQRLDRAFRRDSRRYDGGFFLY